MSTRSVVAYRDSKGIVRGTYIHYDGYPENMKPELKSMFKTSGYDSIVKWIEAGIKGNGYSSIGDIEPYNDGDGTPYVYNVTDEEYGYIMYPSGRVRVFDNH